jgi:hypothetical protein
MTASETFASLRSTLDQGAPSRQEIDVQDVDEHANPGDAADEKQEQANDWYGLN